MLPNCHVPWFSGLAHGARAHTVCQDETTVARPVWLDINSLRHKLAGERGRKQLLAELPGPTAKPQQQDAPSLHVGPRHRYVRTEVRRRAFQFGLEKGEEWGLEKGPAGRATEGIPRIPPQVLPERPPSKCRS